MTDNEFQLREEERTKRSWSNAVGFVWAFAALGFGVFIHRYLSEAAAEIAGFGTASILLTGQAFWRNRRRWWFWGLLATLAIIHALLVVLVPWPPSHEMNKGDAVFAVADFGIVFGAMALAVRVFHGVRAVAK